MLDLGYTELLGCAVSTNWSVIRSTVDISHLHRPNHVRSTVDAAAVVFSVCRSLL